MARQRSDYSISDYWPDGNGPYTVTTHFDVIKGRPECVGLEIWGKSNELGDLAEITPLTASALRIPLGRFIAEARRRSLAAAAAAAVTRSRGKFSARAVEAAGRASNEWADVARSRRPTYGAQHWQEVADIYREAWRRAEPPTTAVRDHFNVSKTTAAKWVAKCRRPPLNLLPATDKGRASAEEES